MRLSIFLLFILSVSITQAQLGAQSNCMELHNKGMKLYYDKDYIKGLDVFISYYECNKGVEDLYNIACLASLAGELDTGFYYMKKAIDLGYFDGYQMEQDSDLENMKRDTRWSSLYERYEKYKLKITEKLAGIKGTLSQNLIPYYKNGKAGFLNKNTLLPVTEPFFTDLTFVGKSGIAEYQNQDISFNKNGGIEKIYITAGVFKSIIAVYEYNCKPEDDMKVGFRTSEGEIFSYGRIYKRFVPVKIKGENFGLVTDSTGCEFLINVNGENLLGTKLSKLTFINFGEESSYDINADMDQNGDYILFYKDVKGRVGYINDQFQQERICRRGTYKPPKDEGQASGFLGKLRRYVWLKQNNKWGVWDALEKEWLFKPRYDKIIRTDSSFKSVYTSKQKEDFIELFFLVEKGMEKFYVDTKGKEFRLRTN